MTLILTIENEQSLPNGAPVSVRLANRRGLDIGRNASLDWTLPDATRFISGKHCEVRYRDDGYWLNDLSTNGTFLNDSARRIQAPHRLRHGDRLAIGPYIIAVAIEADAEPAGADAIEAKPAPEPPSEREPKTLPTDPSPPDPLPESRTEPELRPRAEEEERGGARGFAPLEFSASSRLDSMEPAPTAPAAEGASPWANLDEAREAVGSGVSGPPDDRSAGLLAAQAQDAQVPDAQLPNPKVPEAQAQAREAQAWSPPDRTAPAPANRASIQQHSNQGAGGPESGDAATPGPDEFLRRFALGAGLPEHIFDRQDGLEVAEELGALMRMAVENLTQLLSARFKAKRFARTSSQTMIQAFDNNPLKFAPTSDEALKIMFGQRTKSYLDAKRAFEGAFTDLKTHQVKTFAAMQQAVRMLVEDLDPLAIDESAGVDRGFAALFGGRKTRLWDLYLARWQAKTLRHEDGLVDAFMLYFAECYDQANDSTVK